MCQLFYLKIYPKIRLFLLIIISELRWVNQGGKSFSERLIPRKIQKQLFSKFTLIYLFCFVGTMFSQSQLLSCDATAAEKKLKVKHPLVGDRNFFLREELVSVTLMLSKKIKQIRSFEYLLALNGMLGRPLFEWHKNHQSA